MLGMQVLPNGLGLGGRENCQALFIDDSLKYGHSVFTETYENSCLASSENFEIARVECWLVNPDIVTGAAPVKLTNVVLNRHEKDLAYLESGNGYGLDAFHDNTINVGHLRPSFAVSI